MSANPTPKILLVADPPAGPRLAEHLAEYSTVGLITARDYQGVPFGTEWVLVMNGDGHGGAIFNDARKAGATPLSIPTGWSHAQMKLDRAGFFKRMAAKVAPLPGHKDKPLTSRPLAALAKLKAIRSEADVATALRAEGAMARVEAATAKVEAVAAKAEAIEAALEAAKPTPEPAAPVPERTGPRGDTDYMQAMTRVRVERSQRKQDVLRDLFTRNPDAHIDDALATLRAMAPEGTAVNGDVARSIRGEVRKGLGLPEYPPRAKPRPRRQAPTQAPAAPAVPSPPPPPAEPTLPPDVEAAARLLQGALEAATGVLSFDLTFRQGSKVRVAWQPVNRLTLEL